MKQLKEIIKQGKDGDYIAVCESGRVYNCKYSAKFKVMFFAIPADEIILGYEEV